MLDGIYIASPADPAAERLVISHLMLDGAKAHAHLRGLKAEHFSSVWNAKVFDAAVTLIESNERVNLMTLGTLIDLNLPVDGGVTLDRYIASCSGYSPSFKLTVESIIDCARRRRVIAIGKMLAEQAATTGDLSGMMVQAEADLGNAVPVDADQKTEFTFAESFDALMDQIGRRAAGEQTDSISTGFPKLDRMIGGLCPGRVYVIAARPGVGKSALACDIAASAAGNGIPTGIWSMEMSHTELMARAVAKNTGISVAAIERDALPEADVRMIMRGGTAIRKMPGFIDQRGGMTFAEMSSAIKRSHRKNKLGLVVVDYLQLTRGGANHRGNTTAELTEITVGMKALAKRLAVPIIMLSQLNRGQESKDNKRPVLSSLRGSGSIEQDADCVIFIHREEYHLAEARPDKTDIAKMIEWEQHMAACKGKAEVIVAKCRQGERGTLDMLFDGPTTTFSEITP